MGRCRRCGLHCENTAGLCDRCLGRPVVYQQKKRYGRYLDGSLDTSIVVYGPEWEEVPAVGENVKEGR